MNPGDRPYKVVFQRATSTTDDYGAPIQTWADYCPEYAAISFGTGQERREAATESARAPATFSVPSNSLTRALSVTDRISFDGSYWDITSIVPSRVFGEGFDVTAARAAK